MTKATKKTKAKRAGKTAAPTKKTAKAPNKKAAPKNKKAAAPRKKKAAAKAKAKPAKKTPKKAAPRASHTKWIKFVEEHGVVLASARGPVPSVAEAIAGEPIIGGWWSHPKAQVIFDALSTIDDSEDIRCFKLIDHKVTFVHRRKWPALAKLAEAGVVGPDRAASIQQEHMPTGEHRNIVTPFPDWVPDEVAAAATALTVDDARAQLGAWV